MNDCLQTALMFLSNVAADISEEARRQAEIASKDAQIEQLKQQIAIEESLTIIYKSFSNPRAVPTRAYSELARLALDHHVEA